MVLVDTSVLINFFRGKETPSTRYFESICHGPFYITSIILQEMLQGAKNLAEFEKLNDYLSSQFFCFPSHPVISFEKAAAIFFEARRQGCTVRSTIDCLIAQIAIDNDLVLLHDDKDFEKLANCSALRVFSTNN
jgi:predicted nucleic acid-binding protein